MAVRVTNESLLRFKLVQDLFLSIVMCYFSSRISRLPTNDLFMLLDAYASVALLGQDSVFASDSTAKLPFCNSHNIKRAGTPWTSWLRSLFVSERKERWESPKDVGIRTHDLFFKGPDSLMPHYSHCLWCLGRWNRCLFPFHPLSHFLDVFKRMGWSSEEERGKKQHRDKRV